MTVLDTVNADSLVLLIVLNSTHTLKCVDEVGVIWNGGLLWVIHARVLGFDHFKKVVTLAGREHFFEFGRVHYLVCILHDLILTFVVLTGRYEGALRTALVHHELTLQIHSCFLQLVKAFLFQEFPDLLFGQALTLGY